MSLGLSILVVFSAILVYAYAEFPFDVEKCKEELRFGRKTLQKMIPELMKREHERQAKLRAELYHNFESVMQKDNFYTNLDAYQCTNVNDTTCPAIGDITVMPPTPTKHTTLRPTTEAEETSEWTETTEHESGSTKKAVEDHEKNLYVPPFIARNPEKDYLSSLIKFFYLSLTKEEDVCEGPDFTGLNSVTDDQIFGQMSIFLTSYGQPLCSICDRLVDQVQKWFVKAHTEMADDEAYIFNLYMSRIPPKETICSILLPTCHEEYTTRFDGDAASISTNTTQCLECNICMTGTTIIMQKIILDPGALHEMNHILNETLFHDICSELCHNDSSQFPYCKCREFIQKQWSFFLKSANRILMPNYLCANTLGWCKLNETPNILHCLKDLCEDLTKDMQILKIICDLIPDEPKEADKFLNIRRENDEL